MNNFEYTSFMCNDNNSFQFNNIPLKRKFGFKRNINITNSCRKKAYIIIASTPIRSISTIGVDGIGNIQFEQQGDYRSQEMLILPGQKKFFELHTKKIYVSILIETEKSTWRQWRKNRLIDSSESDYRITPNAHMECLETNFIDYSTK